MRHPRLGQRSGGCARPDHVRGPAALVRELRKREARSAHRVRPSDRVRCLERARQRGSSVVHVDGAHHIAAVADHRNERAAPRRPSDPVHTLAAPAPVHLRKAHDHMGNRGRPDDVLRRQLGHAVGTALGRDRAGAAEDEPLDTGSDRGVDESGRPLGVHAHVELRVTGVREPSEVDDRLYAGGCQSQARRVIEASPNLLVSGLGSRPVNQRPSTPSALAKSDNEAASKPARGARHENDTRSQRQRPSRYRSMLRRNSTIAEGFTNEARSEFSRKTTGSSPIVSPRRRASRTISASINQSSDRRSSCW